MTPTVPPTPPRRRCVVCGEPLTVIWQPGLLPHQSGMWLVTCENTACALYGYTLADSTYPPDLTLYLDAKAVR